MGTEVVESAESLGRWTELINSRFVPLRITSTSSGDQLSGRVVTRRFGHLQASSVQSQSQVFTRPRSLTRTGRELIAVGAVEGGCGYVEQDGRRCEVPAGSFAFYDTSKPFNWVFPDAFRLQVFAWPRGVLGLDEHELRQLTAVPVAGSSGVARFVSPALRELLEPDSDDQPAMTAPVASRLADDLADLCVTAVLAAGGGLSSVSDGDPDVLWATIQTFIEDNLQDPALSARHIAAEFYLSPRTLNRIFARRGLTVATWVKARRLERAKRMLKNPAFSGLPIAAVGGRSGFSSPTVFGRDFAQRYGMSPSCFRASRAD